MKKKIPFIILLIPGLLITACNKGGNSTSNKEEEYNIVRPTVTPDYENFEIGANPAALNMSYYSGVYSRGFSWFTDKSVNENLTDNDLRNMMRDPKYWRDQDPEYVRKIENGFKKLYSK